MKKISEKTLVELALELGALKRVPRTGWVLKGIKDAESVADHTWRVATLAMILAPQLNVSADKLMKMALVHDVGEAAIGDIKWETGGKVIGSREEKYDEEKREVKRMFDVNTDFEEYIDLWEEFHKNESKEAKIIKELDKLDMVLQALEYEREGIEGSLLDEFWENTEKYLKDGVLKNYFEYLKKLREEEA